MKKKEKKKKKPKPVEPAELKSVKYVGKSEDSTIVIITVWLIGIFIIFKELFL